MLVNLENNAFRILGLLVNFGGTNSESVWQKMVVTIGKIFADRFDAGIAIFPKR